MLRRRYAVPTLVAAALVVAGLTPSPAHAATVRYAAPGGTGTTCSASAPCGLDVAVNLASTGDEVVVASGTYPLAVSLARNVGGLYVHGVPGQPRPVLQSSAGRAVDIGQNGRGTHLADLSIVHTGSEYGLNVFAKDTLVERVTVHSLGAVACSPGISGTLRDSLCVTTAAGGIAIDDSWAGDVGQLNLRNVTAVATGAASYGIRADASGGNTGLVIDARNVIASGTAADVRSTRTGDRSVSVVSLRSSNFDTVQALAGGSVSAPTANGNQSAAPVFLDGIWFRQARTSPTVDKGTTYDDLGAVDLDGDARVTGSAPDIGADELDVTPPDTVAASELKKKVRKKRTRIRFGSTEPGAFLCRVDKSPVEACASPYRIRLKRWGKHTVTVTAVDAVGNLDPTPLVWEFKAKKKKKGKRRR